MIAMVAHEVDARKVELCRARCALRDMEDTRMVRVREFVHLPQLSLSLGAVGTDKLLILHSPRKYDALPSQPQQHSPSVLPLVPA